MSEAEELLGISDAGEQTELSDTLVWREDYRQQAFDTMVKLGQISLEVNGDSCPLPRKRVYSELADVSLRAASLIVSRIPANDYRRMNRQYRREIRDRNFKGVSYELQQNSRPAKIAEYLRTTAGRPVANEELAAAITDDRTDEKDMLKKVSGILWDGHVQIRLAQYNLVLHSKKIKISDSEKSMFYIALPEGELPDWQGISEQMKPRFWPKDAERLPPRYGRYVEWITEIFARSQMMPLSARDLAKVCYAEDYDVDDKVMKNRVQQYLSGNDKLWRPKLAERGLKVESFMVRGQKVFVCLPIDERIDETGTLEAVRLTDDQLRELALKLREEEEGKAPAARGWGARRQNVEREPFWDGMDGPEINKRRGMISEWLVDIFGSNPNRPFSYFDLACLIYAEKIDKFVASPSQLYSNIRTIILAPGKFKREIAAKGFQIESARFSDSGEAFVICSPKESEGSPITMEERLSPDELRELALRLRIDEAAYQKIIKERFTPIGDRLVDIFINNLGTPLNYQDIVAKLFPEETSSAYNKTVEAMNKNRPYIDRALAQKGLKIVVNKGRGDYKPIKVFVAKPIAKAEAEIIKAEIESTWHAQEKQITDFENHQRREADRARRRWVAGDSTEETIFRYQWRGEVRGMLALIDDEERRLKLEAKEKRAKEKEESRLIIPRFLEATQVLFPSAEIVPVEILDEEDETETTSDEETEKKYKGRLTKARLTNLDLERSQEAAEQEADELEWRLRAGILLRDSRIRFSPSQKSVLEALEGGVGLERVAAAINVEENQIITFIKESYKRMTAPSNFGAQGHPQRQSSLKKK